MEKMEAVKFIGKKLLIMFPILQDDILEKWHIIYNIYFIKSINLISHLFVQRFCNMNTYFKAASQKMYVSTLQLIVIRYQVTVELMSILQKFTVLRQYRSCSQLTSCINLSKNNEYGKAMVTCCDIDYNIWNIQQFCMLLQNWHLLKSSQWLASSLHSCQVI